MKASAPMEGKVVATVTQKDLDQLVEIGQEQDVEILIEAMMKTLGKIRTEKQKWWRAMGEKYGFDPHPPGAKGCTVNQYNGQICEVPQE